MTGQSLGYLVNGFAVKIALMPKMHKIAEARLKAAVIDRLMSSSHVDDDAVLISEMTVANWSRRADLVLANGNLWAFEIKSEADSLSRLAGQIQTFRTHFEKLTLVVASRFENKVLRTLPEGVGLWVETGDGFLVERVRPRLTALSAEASISLMTANELRRLVGSKCLGAASHLRRQALVELALSLHPVELAGAAREAVKARHRKRYEAFVTAKASAGTFAAIAARPFDVAEREEPATGQPVIGEPAVPDGHPELIISPAGPVLRRRLV